MSSNKTRFSLGLAVGLSLGLAGSTGVAFAGSMSDPAFTAGQTLTHTHMNNVRTAVNDNDTRITNLQGSTGTCVTNNASDVMVRVGPICVDQYKASLWPSTAAGGTQVTAIPGGCLANGTGTCSGMVAQSRAAVTPIDGSVVTWAQAARSCANAGKRLLTAGEWVAARASGVITLASGDAEFVDSFYGRDVDATGSVSRVLGSPYIRNSAGLGDLALGGLDVTYKTVTDTTFGFRCAR